MKQKKAHIGLDLHEHDDPAGFFSRVSIPWEQNKEEIWESFEAKMKIQPKKRTIRLHSNVWRMAAAASLLLLLGITVFLRFYTRTIETFPQQHLTHSFPDQSTVELNAVTTLKYHPYWWRFSREVTLDGEAFFNVEKGKKFGVTSGNGQTIVLGTSFNIYSRNEKYEVTCLTGRVKVIARESDDAIILNPREKAVLNLNGAFNISTMPPVNNVVPWTRNNFSFTNTPLREVLDEIERQYGIRIEGTVTPDAAYTGNFSRETEVDQVLKMISKPFDITFVQTGKGLYQLVYER